MAPPEPPMDEHPDVIRAEFTRQAEPIETATAFRDRRILDRIRQTIGTGGRLLDVACGPGILLADLADRFDSVTGIDLTPAMAERAREKLGAAGIDATVDVGDARDLPYPTRSFDAVVTRLFLHHLDRPAAVVKEIARVLRPGGIAVVTDIVSPEDASAAALHNALEWLRDPTHVRALTESEMLSTIADAGLRVDDVDRWLQPRHLDEWLAIVNEPARAGAVRIVMTELARLGSDAGMGLRVEHDEVVFDHRWVLIAADKPNIA